MTACVRGHTIFENVKLNFVLLFVFKSKIIYRVLALSLTTLTRLTLVTSSVCLNSSLACPFKLIFNHGEQLFPK